MKITLTKEVTVQDAEVNIRIDLDKQKAVTRLSYTCPDCAGHGCGSHGNRGGNPDCHGGSISFTLDLSKIDQNFDAATALKLKSAIHNLYLEMTE